MTTITESMPSPAIAATPATFEPLIPAVVAGDDAPATTSRAADAGNAPAALQLADVTPSPAGADSPPSALAVVSPVSPDHAASNGKFAAGNNANPRGNHTAASRAAILRNEFYRQVTKQDVREIVAKLVEKAKTGDEFSIKLLVDKLIPASAKVEVDVAVAGNLRFAESDIQFLMRLAGQGQARQLAGEAQAA
jgi:hypothetical protein